MDHFVREGIVEPLTRLWPLLVTLLSGVWAVSDINTDVEHNTNKLSEIHQTQKEHIDEAVRELSSLNTKLDILLEREKE